MDKSYEVFENLSLAADVGVTILETSGTTLFESTVLIPLLNFLKALRKYLDCEVSDHVALLYGCYQAQRFGGRYIFFTPSGLAYCAAPLSYEYGEITAGVLIGPFLMTTYDEYIDIDICTHKTLPEHELNFIKSGIENVPHKTPTQVRALSEQLYICATYHSRNQAFESQRTLQSDVFSAAYSIEKEDDLLIAISRGDIPTASALLNDILGQVLFHSGGNLEIMRSRIVELTVLLSRAALKGGANPEIIFGLNYSYLREIDKLVSADDITIWLNGVMQRFSQHVFDYANSKHVDVIFKAIKYIKKNYADKITLQDVADYVFLSPTYFAKIFREETQQTLGNFITAVRIEESKKILRSLSVSIVDIPKLVGFESQSYFTRVFKKAEGCTPGYFRKRCLERNSDYNV